LAQVEWQGGDVCDNNFNFLVSELRELPAKKKLLWGKVAVATACPEHAASM
jgi:hypothetical protein